MKYLSLVLVAVILSVAPVFAQSKSGPSMKFEALEYNFGTIKQGEKVEHTFTFTNAGSEPLIITNAQASCGCTVPDYPKQPLKKGEKGAIKVTFDSAGKMGTQDRTITISSNAVEGATILHVKGVIEAATKNLPDIAVPVEKPGK